MGSSRSRALPKSTRPIDRGLHQNYTTTHVICLVWGLSPFVFTSLSPSPSLAGSECPTRSPTSLLAFVALSPSLLLPQQCLYRGLCYISLLLPPTSIYHILDLRPERLEPPIYTHTHSPLFPIHHHRHRSILVLCAAAGQSLKQTHRCIFFTSALSTIVSFSCATSFSSLLLLLRLCAQNPHIRLTLPSLLLVSHCTRASVTARRASSIVESLLFSSLLFSLRVFSPVHLSHLCRSSIFTSLTSYLTSADPSPLVITFLSLPSARGTYARGHIYGKV